jgi:hypothetical protein
MFLLATVQLSGPRLQQQARDAQLREVKSATVAIKVL